MVSSSLQERMAAFEKGGPVKNKKQAGVASKASAFEKGNVSNATKSYKSNRDLTGIEDKSNKSWQNRSNATPSKIDASGSVTTAATPASKKVGFTPPGAAATPAPVTPPPPPAKVEESKPKASPANDEDGGSPESKSRGLTLPWSGKKADKAEDKPKTPPKAAPKAPPPPKEPKESKWKRKKNEDKKEPKEKEAKEDTAGNPKPKKQILKCLAISLLIIACIVIATITIVTGWGDGSIETEYEKQAAVYGRLVSISEDGFVAVVEDDFGANQVYHLDPNANPKWQPQGLQFRTVGRAQLSGDGRRLAYVNAKTKRLVFEKYDEVFRDWVSSGDAPILGGDDICLTGDFTKLMIGSYGQGSITVFNSKQGEGIITTYKYDGESWLAHGEPLIKIMGLSWFGMSPDGNGLLVKTDYSGNVTLNGYRSESTASELGGTTYEWVKADRLTTFPSTEVDVAVSNGGYAVATAKSAQAYTYSGRTLGQEIVASGNNNITSVSLSADGNTMVVGSVTPGLTGLVDMYRFPAGTTDTWQPLGEALQDNAALFGTAVALSAGSTQIAVESGLPGNENVHFYGVTYKAHRRIG